MARWQFALLGTLGLLVSDLPGRAADGPERKGAAKNSIAKTKTAKTNVTAAKTPAKTPAKTAAASKPVRLDPKGVEFFEKRIRPVLVKNCYSCHSGSAKKVEAGFVLDTRAGLLKGGQSGPAIMPGDDNDSLLMEAIRYEGLEMPPTGKLPDEVIADFATWIRMGAPDPRTGPVRQGPINYAEARKYWAFQPPKKHAPPIVQDAAWPRGEIDQFVLAGMEKNDLRPVDDADRHTLLRRVSFALTGLPPTAEQISAFSKDASPEALAQVIDKLLESPQFGERWGRHWLDVARYGESTGQERNRPYPHAWRYRDYVIDSFNKDKPYDQFIREQIAGDLLPAKDAAERNEHLIATGFLAIGVKGLNERNREVYLMDIVDDQIDASTRAVIGLTVACARCHDHKFDPIPTTDYYAMAGIFRSTDVLAGVVPQRAAKKGGAIKPELMTLSAVGPVSAEVRQEQQKKIVALEADLREAQAELRKLQSGGKPKEELSPKKAAKQKKKAAKQARNAIARAEDEVQRLQDELADLRRGGPKSSDQAMGVEDGERPNDCQVCIRGEVSDRGPSVPRGFVTVMGQAKPNISPGASGRLELARWFTSRQNPLTARVAVNRIWHHLFGTGLVPTTDNFGAMSEPPSHPELLDTLAIQFMDDGWSVKKMIRRIMLSRVYQLSSQHHEANFEADPENRYLWRMSRHRLEAEAIRDAILSASGQLDLKRPAGSSVTQLGDREIGQNRDLSALASGARYRSVYLPIIRQAMPDSLSLFDAADPSLVVGARDATTVATQALYLLNSPFVSEQAQKMAERLLGERELDDPGRIALAYRLALSRLPTKEEVERSISFVREYPASQPGPAWAALCQALFASAEFRYAY
jgi:hypothetical protein